MPDVFSSKPLPGMGSPQVLSSAPKPFVPGDTPPAPVPQATDVFNPNVDPMVADTPPPAEPPPPEEIVTPWQSLSSSNVRRTRYNSGSRVLDVQFSSGHIYHYQDVPLDVYEGLINAGSPGRYVHSVVRGYAFNR